ncbi:trifunctional transcriptional regulator/proline dehydrogenase/L-glutamate gamma-semialdehyde dehydrogenase [Sandaracinobacteroides hominis]|uniref:trifunctional transcriptional regulator/proline dehydrogenase/L-glutamate gamma-semialdehyde dehydrogenase n=1 Tax=Sandaracinobacteroides hominis TaxID=2780086 RepID=UPI0018F3E3E4|nr:trifunctional transcriptional regulator/proline dehydrogenase/L-glutamate gamma-semialdehyde dehydrogenase [Sandaracinobacteroides hominis]
MPASRSIFAAFAPPVREATPLRSAITAAYRRPEPECIADLLPAATLPESVSRAATETARALISRLRAKTRGSGVEALVQEYALSSQEGVALMCLAEALLRIPDTATRDALIRDKIAPGDWSSHLGSERSLFVNAATWGLVVTGKLVDPVNDGGLASALGRLVARAGEPVVRRGVDIAMRLMGEQFVTGETIAEALKRARDQEAIGFTYSFDMLGEAAATARDAEGYFTAYATAIHAIGKSAEGRGPIAGNGISIKLSALHPRYSRAQSDRVMGELLPRVKSLALLARSYDIGFNVDAEEADRLEISLDILESLALDPSLAGWQGLGFVVQAYGKRCPFVIDWIVDLARRASRRIMVRLVKGAYWDAEIKRAQVDGLADFPVYTRKIHTDVAYIACAAKLLAAKDAVFPQFATHNAQTLATIYQMAGTEFTLGDYEFQCLHGMGEPLYEEVVGRGKLNRPCRIYAPVGTHETLLAYLVRRLLENGANSSFVNRIADPDVSIDELVADPVALVAAMPSPGAPHDLIASPANLYPGRRNSAGLDLSDESALAALTQQLNASVATEWLAAPEDGKGSERRIHNPADHRDIVGTVRDMAPVDAAAAVARAAASRWGDTPVDARAAMLERAADTLQDRMPILMGLLMREAGKSAANSISEVREAIDFLRYYAAEARRTLEGATPVGPTVCISPWNFPLAIFTGQLAAALVAGNPVLAKPAEETPLIAAEAVRLLHAAGVPNDALQLIPGDGPVGAALVAAPETAAVLFTGSTEVARLIQAQLAARLSASGQPIPFIAETGGQNAMIVDSSSLPEQVVADVLASAFDSAGQRCSALRILCLQEEVAGPILTMLKGALAELRIGNTTRLSVDVGPVITPEAKAGITAHIELMRRKGHPIQQLPLPAETASGSFVPPTLIEMDDLADLQREVFGPVLHVIRYRRQRLDKLIDAINATGYGLTFGLHTRLEETIAHVTGRIQAGNRYVNRNIIGAVVGVQPFGGRGLSGTGPKAGGPLYLGRLANPTSPLLPIVPEVDPALAALADWLEDRAESDAAATVKRHADQSRRGLSLDLPGPVGESNRYQLHARGTILLKPATDAGLWQQLAAALATGNRFLLEGMDLPAGLPAAVRKRLATSDDMLSGALLEGDADQILAGLAEIAARPGAVLLVQSASPAECASARPAYRLDWLVEEISTSINTTAAGGNASLMTLA